MKAMILAAGLGTRLKPWTLNHPKALVPVGGVPMLERVIRKLEKEGFNDIVVNIHHFGDQIIDFLKSRQWQAHISISDERGELLDTGGGISRASGFLGANSQPFLVHNVDILSSADLSWVMRRHEESGRDISLLVSDRVSSRKLIFDEDGTLMGWHNLSTGELRRAADATEADWMEIKKLAEDDNLAASGRFNEYAFSGIHVMSPDSVFTEIKRLEMGEKFPIMDFFLNGELRLKIGGIVAEDLRLIDIGKPETLQSAESMFKMI